MFRLFYSDLSDPLVDEILKKIKSMGPRSLEFIPEVVKLIQTRRETNKKKNFQRGGSGDFIIDFVLPTLIRAHYDDSQSVVWFQAME